MSLLVAIIICCDTNDTYVRTFTYVHANTNGQNTNDNTFTVSLNTNVSTYVYNNNNKYKAYKCNTNWDNTYILYKVVIMHFV